MTDNEMDDLARMLTDKVGGTWERRTHNLGSPRIFWFVEGIVDTKDNRALARYHIWPAGKNDLASQAEILSLAASSTGEQLVGIGKTCTMIESLGNTKDNDNTRRMRLMLTELLDLEPPEITVKTFGVVLHVAKKALSHEFSRSFPDKALPSFIAVGDAPSVHNDPEGLIFTWGCRADHVEESYRVSVQIKRDGSVSLYDVQFGYNWFSADGGRR